MLGWCLTATQGVLQPSEYATLSQLVKEVTNLAFRFQHLARQFFEALDHFLGEQREGRQLGMYAQQERILPATRTQPAWEEVEIAWDEAQYDNGAAARAHRASSLRVWLRSTKRLPRKMRSSLATW